MYPLCCYTNRRYIGRGHSYRLCPTKERQERMSKTVLLLTSMALGLLLVCGVVLAATVNCEGTSLDGPCLGTSGADTLYGTPYEDHIEGRGGSDKIYGFEGDYDQLQGDLENRTDLDGNDRVYGGPGSDNIIWLFGGADVAKGHGDRDTIVLIDDNVNQQTVHVPGYSKPRRGSRLRRPWPRRH
jgi:RTX calcium-binding nonapeptide repeat (4 copies)